MVWGGCGSPLPGGELRYVSTRSSEPNLSRVGSQVLGTQAYLHEMPTVGEYDSLGRYCIPWVLRTLLRCGQDPEYPSVQVLQCCKKSPVPLDIHL